MEASDKTMKILVTAGGTREDIDDVRGITNYSTGRLGSEIAGLFLDEGAEVTYICGENAILSSLPYSSANLEIIKIRNVAQLAAQLENALNSTKYNCVIHSMAVSDYTPVEPKSDSKISSDLEYITITLQRTPKVINIIKKIQPQTTLIGFKLLSNSSENELVEAGLNLLKNSKCDYILANDLKNITETHHKAILLNSDGIMARAENKQEIAEIIYKKITGGAK